MGLFHIAFDTETSGFRGEALACQWVEFTDRTIGEPKISFGEYTSVDEFLDSIKGYQKLCLWAHNIAFDLPRLRATGRVTFRANITGSQFLSGVMLIDDSDTLIELRDSFRIAPKSLDAFTKAFSSIKKLTGSINFEDGEIFDRNNPDHVAYALNDVTGLASGLQGYIKTINANGGNLKLDRMPLTITKIAFSILQKKSGEITGHNSWRGYGDEKDKKLRLFYRGGRVFLSSLHNRHTPVDCTSLDITSAYPEYSRSLLPIDGEYPKYTKGLPPDINGVYFIKIKVYDYTHILPICPYDLTPDKKDRTWIYPHGTFITTLTSDEYIFFLTQDTRHDVIESYYYFDRQLDKHLESYVNTFYELKKAGDRANKILEGSGETVRELAKLMLNAPTGKIGQKPNGDCLDSVSDGFNIDKLESKLKVHKSSINEFRNVGIIALITGRTRVQLYKAMTYYGVENILQTDTDSIKVVKSVYDSKLKMCNENDELGGWKNEGDYLGFFMLAPKVYAAINNGKTVIKGKGLPLKHVLSISHNGQTILKKGAKTHKVEKVKEVLYNCIKEGKNDLVVEYAATPNRLKTVIRTGEYATGMTKNTTNPYMVTGYDYDSLTDTYQVRRIYED